MNVQQIKGVFFCALLLIFINFSNVFAQQHFTFTSNTGDTYSIVINSVTIDNLSPSSGDEVGVFTSAGLCVGATVLPDTLPAPLTAWANDTQTSEVDGFTSGDTMFFRFWDVSKNTEVQTAEPQYTKGNGTFDDGPYAAVSFDFITAVEQRPSGTPRDFVLFYNFPNPFNPETTIHYQLLEPGKVLLQIFNLLGEEVRRMADGYEVSGLHRIQWNGKDDRGSVVSSGIYIYRLEVESLNGRHFIDSKKMILMR